MELLFFGRLGSTNDKAWELLGQGRPEGLVVAARRQDGGRGQHGARWESRPWQNLTFSVALRPDFLPAESMFYLSKSVALGVADFLRSEGIRAAIKWPNDIYVADKKICGILIEQRICGERIAQSVVGVGLNVNQRRFAAPHATSMRRCDGKVRSLREALAALAAAILRRYEALRAGGEAQGWAEVDREYAERLYRGSGFFPYRCGGKTFSACVDAALPSGELVLRLEDGTRRCFAFKEVEFVR